MHTDLAEHHATLEVSGDALRAEPTKQVQNLVSTEQGLTEQGGDAARNAETALPCDPPGFPILETPESSLEMQPQESPTAALVDSSSEPLTQVQSDADAPTLPGEGPEAIAAESASTRAEVPARSIAAADGQAPIVGPLDHDLNESSSNSPKVTVQLGPKTIEVAEAAWAAVQAQQTAAHGGASRIPMCSPPHGC
jgi:hypothetical protein